jgi:hypothetical protein
MNWKSPSFLAKAILVGVVVIVIVEFAFFSVNERIENSKPNPEVPVLLGFEEYQDQIDLLKGWEKADSFCQLELKNAVMRNSKGSWKQVNQIEPCFTISEDLDNRQFSRQELESASNWYAEFLLAEVFDGTLLNDPDGLMSWLEVQAPNYFSKEVLALVSENPGGEFEVDGSIVDADEMVAAWGKESSKFYAFTNDGGPRILAIEGSLDAEFFSLEKNQIDLTGEFFIYYRVDKTIYIETLIEKENWTLVALKEQHPELFDTSPLAVRFDASVGHTLEKTDGNNWEVIGWKLPSYKYSLRY